MLRETVNSSKTRRSETEEIPTLTTCVIYWHHDEAEMEAVKGWKKKKKNERGRNIVFSKGVGQVSVLMIPRVNRRRWV